MDKLLEEFSMGFRSAANDLRINKTLQNELEIEHHIQVYIQFAVSENMWKAEAHSGNDLVYHGDARKIGDAIANAIDDLIVDR